MMVITGLIVMVVMVIADRDDAAQGSSRVYILISQGYNWIGLGAVGELFEPGAKPSLFTQSALLGSFRCATIRFFFFESVWKSLIRFIQVLLELVGPCLTDSVSAHPYLGILILAVCTLRHSRKHNCNSFDQMGVWGREGEGGQYLDVS